MSNRVSKSRYISQSQICSYVLQKQREPGIFSIIFFTHFFKAAEQEEVTWANSGNTSKEKRQSYQEVKDPPERRVKEAKLRLRIQL